MSEDVLENVWLDRFRIWEETGRYLNPALLVGACEGIGTQPTFSHDVIYTYPLNREAKRMAASQGKTIRQFFTEAIAEKLRTLRRQPSPRPLMKHYGALKEYADELREIDRVVEEEFETVDLEDWK